LWALINNAGNSYVSPTEHFEEEKARNLLETHFWGMAQLTRLFIPLLRQYAKAHSAPARLLNIGSVGSLTAFPFIPFYNAAKFAVLGFSESLRLELDPLGIRVGILLPGAVKTGIWQRTQASLDETLASLDADQKAVYAYNLQRANTLSSALEREGLPPEAVAVRIQSILEGPFHRFRYSVGRDAILVGLLIRLLPARLRLALLRYQLKFRSA